MVKMTAAHKLSVVHACRFRFRVDTFLVVDLLVLIRFPISGWHVIFINKETCWFERVHEEM